jgi:D-lactate dehydrogenase
MKIIVYSTKPYDETFLKSAAEGLDDSLTFLETRLTTETVQLAADHDVVCVFVNDQLDADILKALSNLGVRMIALRCAGFNNVDLKTAAQLGICVARVPAYSPHAVAEHAVALILSLNRNIHRAYGRTRDGNFSLDGLLGFDIYGSCVGVVGTGKIGFEFAKIMHGFGCEVLGYDHIENPECKSIGMHYVPLDELFARSDIISLHCPLTPETHHLIDDAALKRMKDGVTLINTSRGAVVDTAAVIAGLKSGKIGRLGLDVYEEEADFFFEDLSNRVIPDDTLSRLLTFPNVLITGHQAFFTKEALTCIAETTLENIREFGQTGACKNSVEAT